MKLNIVGVDPSLRNLGIVIAELDTSNMTFEVVDMRLLKSEDNATKQKTVRKNSDDLRRATILQKGLIEACKDASFAFVEIPVGSQSARAMASYGICIGVLSSCPIPMIQVTPTEVKLAGTNIKSATKEEMIDAAVKDYPYAPWMKRKIKGQTELLAANEHLADALFAIKAGIATEQFKSAVELYKKFSEIKNKSVSLV